VRESYYRPSHWRRSARRRFFVRLARCHVRHPSNGRIERRSGFIWGLGGDKLLLPMDLSKIFWETAGRASVGEIRKRATVRVNSSPLQA